MEKLKFLLVILNQVSFQDRPLRLSEGTVNDANTIYVTTSGALFAPINGTYTEGAKVVAVKLNK